MINFSFAMLNPGVYLQRRILLTKTETMYMNPDILKYSLKKNNFFSPTNTSCAPYCFVDWTDNRNGILVNFY